MKVEALCREGAMNLELLTEAILKHWKPSNDMNFDNILLDERNISQAHNEGGYMYYY